MKRWTLFLYEDGEPDAREDPTGSWVKFADVETRDELLRRAVEACGLTIRAIGETRWVVNKANGDLAYECHYMGLKGQCEAFGWMARQREAVLSDAAKLGME